MSETVVSPTTAAAAPVFAPIAPSNHSDHISNSNNGPVINNVAEISASHSSADPSHPVADNTTSSSTEGTMKIFRRFFFRKNSISFVCKMQQA